MNAERVSRILSRYGDTPTGQVPHVFVRDVRNTFNRLRGPGPSGEPGPHGPSGEPTAPVDPPVPDPPGRAVIPYEDRVGFGPCSVLSVDPPIFLSGIAFREFVGMAGAFGRRYGSTPAAFVLYPTWSIGSPDRAARVIAAARTHQARFPTHVLVFACNTAEERDRLVAGGLDARLLNKNCLISEETFHPLDGVEPEFEAVYNARFEPFKRHHLAGGIDTVAYLAFDNPVSTAETRQAQREVLAALLARHPGHVLVNPLEDGLPVRMAPGEVNVALNRAAVGLCLSAVEGANNASTEYLLAGLPVVSTPSIGGRDHYFDPDYCTICDPDPIAVREAVEALRSRHIPRAAIREATLARIEPDRRRFLNLIDDLSVRLGGKRRHDDGIWRYSSVEELLSWDDHGRHLVRFEQLRHPDQVREPEPDATIRALLAGTGDVQLQLDELRPIVEVIGATPKCALLVFGCGNDSVFWERVNTGGTTVFLEDDPVWAADVSSRLDRSTVHLVEYGTVMSDWQRLLRAPEQLELALPEEVTRQRFDVIVVDALAGWEQHLEMTGREAPGRMQSIYAASQLVAPGGYVFVHDCDRIIEQTYATEYLGRDRLFVRAEGRALLQGYQF